MLRFLVSFLVVGALAPFAAAQRKVEYTTIPMTLHPASLPVPLSKINLGIGYPDLIPGNRVQGLLKVFMEQDNFFRIVNSEAWHAELEMPLAEFKEKSKHRNTCSDGIAYGGKYTKMMGYLDKGARFKSIEWNEYFELRNDGFYMLLPEVQKMRSLASVLHMRLRNEIVTGQFDKACVTIQSLVGMAQALEQHPCLIGNLVALAIMNIAAKGIEEMVAQPGCPNLFWGLVGLPHPIVNQRIAVGGEMLFLISSFERFLKKDRSLSDAEIEEFLTEMNEILKLEEQRGGFDRLIKDARIRFSLIIADLKRIEQARSRLIQDGVKESIVKEMPAMQIAILDEFYRYIVLRDEFFKAYQLPYHIAAPFIAKTEKEMRKAKANGDIIGPALLPAVWKVKLAQARIDQRFALFQAIEAIRLYAKDHDGKLPASLADTGLPMIPDPFSGKNLNYSVKGDTATLFGADTEQGQANNRKYEIRIVK